eukprot:scaffold29945_cov112-Isochrysis_galbana.AAC.3
MSSDCSRLSSSVELTSNPRVPCYGNPREQSDDSPSSWCRMFVAEIFRNGRAHCRPVTTTAIGAGAKCKSQGGGTSAGPHLRPRRKARWTRKCGGDHQPWESGRGQRELSRRALGGDRGGVRKTAGLGGKGGAGARDVGQGLRVGAPLQTPDAYAPDGSGSLWRTTCPHSFTSYSPLLLQLLEPCARSARGVEQSLLLLLSCHSAACFAGALQLRLRPAPGFSLVRQPRGQRTTCAVTARAVAAGRMAGVGEEGDTERKRRGPTRRPVLGSLGLSGQQGHTAHTAHILKNKALGKAKRGSERHRRAKQHNYPRANAAQSTPHAKDRHAPAG